jgi:hypothetical protein
VAARRAGHVAMTMDSSLDLEVLLAHVPAQ